MLIYHCSRDTGIWCSDGTRRTEPPYLAYLCRGEPSEIRGLSNVDHDVANLAAMVLTPEEMTELVVRERVVVRDERGSWLLMYFPDKLLVIIDYSRDERPEYVFADISQYDERLKLPPDDPRQRVKLATEVASRVYNLYCELGFRPQNLISPTNVFKRERLARMDVPDVIEDDIPIEALELAQACCKGGWVEAVTLGHFGVVYDYDIKSAYPAETARLLDVRRGRWVRSTEYQPQARYGYLHCEVMTDAPWHPILHEVGAMTVAGNGIYETCITKAEYDFIHRWDIGYATILDGWWWIPNDAPQHELFKGVVRWLYEQKEASSGLKRELVKKMLNGTFYGLFLQRVGADKAQPGRFYLPFYGAEIQVNTRLKVAEVCYANKVRPLHVAVDGFLSRRRLAIEGHDIGGWKLSHVGPAIVAGTMVWAVRGKQTTGAFSLSYDWLMERISADPGADSYTMETETVMTLGRAVMEKRLDELGRVVRTTRSVNIGGGDNRRLFPRLPKNGGDLVRKEWRSVPWDESMLRAMTTVRRLECVPGSA